MMMSELWDTRIARIEWARLEGRRPRKAGCNARLGEHGAVVRPPIARITTDQGAEGFGWCWIASESAESVVGCSLAETLGRTEEGFLNVDSRFRALEYPILDLAGKLAGKPVYALLGEEAGSEAPTDALQVPCYDTSLYMDDLHLADDDKAAELIAGEARDGYERGHRAFKIKVGRGAMHMELEAGTRRDIRVITAVRAAVGPGCRIMIDANNGYNLNLAKRVLAETAEAEVYWIEEAFHEDAVLYGHLRDWLRVEGQETLIADGEGGASQRLLGWAERGLIDVVQYDVLRPGFSRWLEVGPMLDRWGTRSAPHHYGEPFGNYAACHLATAIRNFEGVEWDDAAVPALDASAYAIVEGEVRVPDLPGFGLALDEDRYAEAVAADGFCV
jgi:L-alanine-DL-glutamate epimerase-like enolase superfamily enzyme